MQRKVLKDMNKTELDKIMTQLEIPGESSDTLAIKVQRIEESGKFKPINENGTSGIKIDEKGRRIHPTLGTYRKVTVTPIEPMEQNTSIFVSINAYTAEFKPREMVELPTEIIKLLKSPRVPQHYYDSKAVSENGNIGAHMTRYVAKYVVESAE